MNKQPGKVNLEGTMLELSKNVDGAYFTASGGFYTENGVDSSIAFELGFTGEEFRNERKAAGVVGTASWFASNGNNFLYASANLYGDAATARDVRSKLAAAFAKAQEDIYQNESGKPGGIINPFEEKKDASAQQQPGQGGLFIAPTANKEQETDIIAALSE